MMINFVTMNKENGEKVKRSINGVHNGDFIANSNPVYHMAYPHKMVRNAFSCTIRSSCLVRNFSFYCRLVFIFLSFTFILTSFALSSSLKIVISSHLLRCQIGVCVLHVVHGERVNKRHDIRILTC